MRATCHEVLDHLNLKDDPIFKLALKLESIALQDPYFIEKTLYPNVDFLFWNMCYVLAYS